MKYEMVDVHTLEYPARRTRWLNKKLPDYISLVAYIKENGTEDLDPILVHGLRVVDGVFRCEATKEAGAPQIPVRRLK